MCDRVAIISSGVSVASGTVAEVLSTGRMAQLIVRLDDLQGGLAALRAAGVEATVEDDHLRVELPPEDGARVTEILASHRLFVSELRPEAVSLETVFLELTTDPNGNPST